MMKTISKKVAKKGFLFLVMVSFSLFSLATNYYVSSSTGNDANSGLSSSLPWKTLTKVNVANFAAGDQIMFQRGDTFYGTLTVKNSGTAGNPITFGAYGTGANPIITGFTQVSSWTNLGSNIWESTNAVSTLSYLNIVSINGVNATMGRTPNLGSYYFLQSHTANTSITSSDLTGTPNWTGAEVCQRKENWIWQTETITSQSGSTITYTDEGTYSPRDGNGFFIQSDSRTLDVQNEWYYNTSTKKIRIYSTSQPINVYVPTVERVIDSYNKSYVTIENLTVMGGNSYNVKFQTGNNIIIQNCNILKSGQFGIHTYDLDNYTINANTIKNSNFTAISTWSSLSSDYETITNNVIDSTFMVIGVGLAAGSAGIITDVDHSLVQYNSINHSGYNGIMVRGQHGQVRNNFIQNSLNWCSDGGGIYTTTDNTALVIDGNIVLNSIGYVTAGTSYNGARGIYLDSNSSNITVSNNTIAHCWEGIYLNSGSDHNTITRNTVFDCTKAQMGFNNSFQGAGSVNSNTVTNNIFVAKKINTGIQWYDDQLCFYAYSEYDDIAGMISSASGNIYSRPIDDTNSIRVYQPSTSGGTDSYKTLNLWQTFSGQDTNSKKSPQSITTENDFQFEYNNTKTIKTVTLAGPKIDMKGSKYVESVTLQPFTSIVLMKDLSPAVAPDAPTLVVATAGDASATVSFMAPANDGGSAITGYTVTSIPAGGIDSNAGSTSLTHTITGLTNGTSYTFTVKASNSAGTSVASTASNSVIPSAPVVAPVTEYTQTLELKKGYNMISTYVMASDPIVSQVTQPIVADGNLIKIQDETGNSFENWGSFGGWINNLGSLQQTEGYKIKVAENCTLQVTGRQIALPMDIPLNTGWNIISFPRTDALDAMMIVKTLIDQNKLVKVQDEAGNSIEDWGIYGGWKNGIGNFIPGKAYRVKMSASAVLTIQENYPKSANLPVYAEKTSYFTSQTEGNGVDHMNINLVGLKEAGLSVGDEMAAFDGDICVGTLKITPSNLSSGSASLVASSTTSSQLKDGFKDGTSVQLYVWKQMNGLETKVEATAIKGSLHYQKNASILAKMKNLTTSVASPIAKTLKTEVYPNPSQGQFTVRFSELPEAGSRIEVLDLSGRKVASRLITGISEDLNLYGQAAGLYLVKSILGSSEQIQKMVIQ